MCAAAAAPARITGRAGYMYMVLLLVLLGAALQYIQGAEPPIKMCTGGVVFAECFGFNATDGTAALQAAVSWLAASCALLLLLRMLLPAGAACPP